MDPNTGKPKRLVIEDDVDFKTAGFPMAIKRESMIVKMNANKVAKVKAHVGAQMNVRDMWELALEKVIEWESRFEKYKEENHTS